MGQRDIPLDIQLVDSLGAYDIMVVPGGTLHDVKEQCSKVTGLFMQLIKWFSMLPRSMEGRPRILL